MFSFQEGFSRYAWCKVLYIIQLVYHQNKSANSWEMHLVQITTTEDKLFSHTSFALSSQQLTVIRNVTGFHWKQIYSMNYSCMVERKAIPFSVAPGINMQSAMCRDNS